MIYIYIALTLYISDINSLTLYLYHWTYSGTYSSDTDRSALRVALRRSVALQPPGGSRAPQRETSVRSCAHPSGSRAETLRERWKSRLPSREELEAVGRHSGSEASLRGGTMSASPAKVSRKENSNHDGAEETSGNVKEWRLSGTTPFSFVVRPVVISSVVVVSVVCSWSLSLLCVLH